MSGGSVPPAAPDPAREAPGAPPARRWPLIPTLIVGAAIAIMVGLGIWQLERMQAKSALIARYASAPDQPPIAWPLVTDEATAPLFRRSSGRGHRSGRGVQPVDPPPVDLFGANVEAALAQSGQGCPAGVPQPIRRPGDLLPNRRPACRRKSEEREREEKGRGGERERGSDDMAC